MLMYNEKEIYATMKNGKVAVFPKFILSVANCAFKGNPNISEIKLTNIHVIGERAFKQCRNLEKIIFSDCLIKIGIGAFAYCEKLTEIELPDKVTIIDDCAFVHCGFKSITLPKGLQKLAFNVFRGCHNLERVTFPDSIKEIKLADKWFENCDNLKEISVCADCTIENGTLPEKCRVIYREL